LLRLISELFLKVDAWSDAIERKVSGRLPLDAMASTFVRA